MSTLDLFLLKSFLAVARTGSISAAALEVGRTQSALSMQMQRLEAALGQPLLHRSGGGVELTATGERLVAHADRLLGLHDEIVAELTGAGLIGALRFGCPEDYAVAMLPPLLKSFCALHPGVEIELVCAPTVELRPLLHRRQIEMALVSTPEAAKGPDVIRPEPLVWAAHQPRPDLLDRDQIPLALSAPASVDHRAARDVLERAGRAYRIAYASSSMVGLIAVVRSGQAITVLTRTAVPPDLHILDAGLPALPQIGVSLAFAAARPSALARAFGAHIRDQLS